MALRCHDSRNRELSYCRPSVKWHISKCHIKEQLLQRTIKSSFNFFITFTGVTWTCIDADSISSITSTGAFCICSTLNNALKHFGSTIILTFICKIDITEKIMKHLHSAFCTYGQFSSSLESALPPSIVNAKIPIKNMNFDNIFNGFYQFTQKIRGEFQKFNHVVDSHKFKWRHVKWPRFFKTTLLKFKYSRFSRISQYLNFMRPNFLKAYGVFS